MTKDTTTKAKKTFSKMEVTNAELNYEILPSLQILGSLKIKNIDVLMNIAKFRKDIQEHTKTYSEVHKTISEADCEKDKAGNPVFDTIQTPKGPQQMYRYATEDLNNEMRTRIEQLNAKTVTISFTPIKSSELKEVEGLTANIIVALREFIIE